MPRAQWLASLAEMANFRFTEGSHLKGTRLGVIEKDIKHPALVSICKHSDKYRHIHKNHTHKHTHTHGRQKMVMSPLLSFFTYSFEAETLPEPANNVWSAKLD